MTNIYKLALQVQDASNPNGVIRSLYTEVLPGIHAEPGYREIGTAYVASHPALILFLDKLNSMTGLQSIGDADSYDRIHNAYAYCNRLAFEGEPPAPYDGVVAPDGTHVHHGGDTTCRLCRS